jgi:hypothetical protein
MRGFLIKIRSKLLSRLGFLSSVSVLSFWILCSFHYARIQRLAPGVSKFYNLEDAKRAARILRVFSSLSP